MKEHFSSRVTKLLVILALAIVASVMFVIVGCDGGKDDTTVCTNHTWVADTTRSDIAATCDKDGVHYVVCSNCGMASSEVIQATGHHWKDDGALQVEPATCTENGYYYRLCEDCGYRETSSVIYAVGHMLDMNAVTVTPADCTTDGSITGACVNCQESITLKADEIVISGDNANVKNFDRDALEKKAAEAKQEWFAEPATAADENNDSFLQAFGHDWLAGSKVDIYGNLAQPCVENPAATAEAKKINKNDTQKYAGYCERCKTLVPVSDHDKPAGAANCIAAIDNKNMSQADIDAVAPLNRATHAYHCDVCDQDIKVGGHNNQICTLVSGNPLYGTAVYEPVEGNVTSLDCHYYYVCIDCGEVVVATPHTMPLATDTANAANCAHGAKCTVCGLELTRALAHNTNGHMWDSDDETFGTFTYAPATCTKDEQKYDYCTMCKAREDAGEEVKWELGKNYKFVGIKAFNHDDWDSKSYEVKTVALDGSTLTNCLTGYGSMDICKRCGETRVSLKPDFYSASTNEKNETVYTKIEKKADFDSAKAKDNVYTLVNGKYTKIEAAVTWETDKYGLDYTDANGVYDKVTDGKHDMQVMAFKDYEVDQQSRFDQYYKPNCQNEEQVNVLHQCKLCGTTTWDYVSLEVFATKVMGKDSVQDYINSRNDWHAGEHMLVCPHGNSYCEECAVGNHNAQYYINFKVVDGINVAIPQQVYFACIGDTNEGATLGNIEYFAKQMNEFIAEYAGIYNFKFFSVYNDTTKTELPADFKQWTDIIHDKLNGETTFEDVTVYATVEMVPSTDASNKYFNTSANKTAQWTQYSNENTRPVIDGISFQFSESFIGHENISRIEVTLQRTAQTAAGTETTVYGTVTSTGDQLTALLDSLDYSKVATDPMITVDVYGLGYNNMNGTVPNGFWTTSNSNFIEQVVVGEETVSQYVTGQFELVITMMTNVGTFTNTQTITLA